MNDPGYRCRGCGEQGSVVEVSLVPRIVAVAPSGDVPGDIAYGSDEAFWEAETLLGYGCTNAACAYWNGTFGLVRREDGSLAITPALPLALVAA